MSVRKILECPTEEKLLREKSSAVENIDKETQKIIRDLKDTLKDNGGGAGIAAPQIGVHKRIVIVRFGQDEKNMQPPLALINPVIVSEGPYVKGFDGCLSNPGILTWDTLRPQSLTFRALDQDGHELEMTVSGIDSRLVHHEIDHLEGILFLDRLRPGGKVYQAVEDENGEEEFVKIPVPEGAGSLASK